MGVLLRGLARCCHRSGVAGLVEDLHRKAQYFAAGLQEESFLIRNEICFNQVLVSGGTAEMTKKTLENVQASGECWCGGALWKGEPVIRLSVCSYRTTEEDIDRAVKALVSARTKAGLESSSR